MTEGSPQTAKILAIGGGKGGIGKSFIISNIAHYLAGCGHRVVLIDVDLGGANLHSFFGIDRPRTTLTEFFEAKIPLELLVTETGVPNLGLLVGATDSLAADHIQYSQKLKLFRHIRQLKADFILVDIGAGAHFHAMDTFLLADTPIAVVVPEIIAVENLYYFLKSVYYRKLTRLLAENGHKTLVAEAWKNRQVLGIANLRELTEHLRAVSDQTAALVDSALEGFQVNIVLNMVRRRQEIRIGQAVKSICLKYFGIHSRFVGFIEYEEMVSRCINKRQPYMQAYPGSLCSEEIKMVVDNLIEGKAFS